MNNKEIKKEIKWVLGVMLIIITFVPLVLISGWAISSYVEWKVYPYRWEMIRIASLAIPAFLLGIYWVAKKNK